MRRLPLRHSIHAGAPAADCGHSYGQLPFFSSILGALEPVFGAACVAPLASQRAWVLAADATLKAMRERGAFLAGYQVIAYPSSAAARKVESLAAGFRRSAQGLGASPALNRTSRLRSGRLFFCAAAADTPESEIFRRHLAHALGSEYAGRSFIVAHEFAHAWQARNGYEAIRRLCLDVGGIFGAEVAEFADPFRLDGRKSPAARLFSRLEESFCDAAAAWSLSIQGHRAPYEAAAAFRDARFGQRSASAPYRTSWLLDKLAALGGEPASDFEVFWSQALAAASAMAPDLFIQEDPRVEHCRLNEQRWLQPIFNI